MHRSPAFLVVCLLALVTGVACLRAAAVVTPPPLPPPSPNLTATTRVALVHRFYTAVNTALRTGETTALEALVAEELIAHPAPAGDASGRADLIRHLLALRTIFPDLQVIVDDLQATTANQVTARLQTTGHEAGTFLGLPVPPGVVPWPPLEQFRIEENRIVERWLGTETPVHLVPLVRTTRPAPRTGTAYLQVARVTYPPSSMVPSGSIVDQRLTYLEEVTRTVSDTQLSGSHSDAWGTTIAAPAGMLTPADPGLSAMVREDDAAVVLEVMIFDGLPEQRRPTSEHVVNVEATVLATVLVAELDWPGMEIAVGQVILTPGATLAFPSAPGSLLLVVETGDLEVTADAGRVAAAGTWLSIGSRPPSQVPAAGVVSGPLHQEPVAAGVMALLGMNAKGLWHNPGPQPATVLVLAITPNGEEPRTPSEG